MQMWRFQSTLPVWGATAWTPWHSCELSYFNPRSPCGERPVRVIMSSMIHMHFNPRSPCGERLSYDAQRDAYKHISIHAPRVGSDSSRALQSPGTGISIHAPRVGSDGHLNFIRRGVIISIHAPRVGSDLVTRPPL